MKISQIRGLKYELKIPIIKETTMDKDKIKSLLEQKFNREPIYPKKRHILFWYDKGAKAGEVIDELDLENVKIIKLAREEYVK